MEQLHFRLNFRGQVRVCRSQTHRAWSRSPTVWIRFGHFQFWLKKKAKLQLDVLKLCRNFGAGDRGRTGDVQLGKLAFYH
jgi:hypothetical protein